MVYKFYFFKQISYPLSTISIDRIHRYLLHNSANLHKTSASNKNINGTERKVLRDNDHGITSPDKTSGDQSYI